MTVQTRSESYLSSGDYLAVIRDFALNKGMSLDKFLKNTPLDITDIINPPELVSSVVAGQVAMNLYGEFEEPVHIAFELGQAMNAQSHGSLGLAVRYADCLEDAFGILNTFYHTRINSQDLVIDEQEESVRLRIVDKVDQLIEPVQVQRFFNLATLVSIASNTVAFLPCNELPGCMTLMLDIPAS